MTGNDEHETATQQAPWFDKLIPVSVAVGIILGGPLWYHTAPAGYAGLWPFFSVMAGALFPGILLFAMGEL